MTPSAVLYYPLYPGVGFISRQEEYEILEREKYLEKQNAKTDRKKQISLLERRCRELDRLIEKLYEDHVEGVLGEERMKKLLSRYEGENHEISVKIKSLKTNVSNERKEDTIEQLKKVLRGFTEPEKLSRELLFHFIDRIEIGQGSYRETEFGRIKKQSVRIYFRFRKIIS